MHIPYVLCCELVHNPYIQLCFRALPSYFVQPKVPFFHSHFISLHLLTSLTSFISFYCFAFYLAGCCSHLFFFLDNVYVELKVIRESLIRIISSSLKRSVCTWQMLIEQNCSIQQLRMSILNEKQRQWKKEIWRNSIEWNYLINYFRANISNWFGVCVFVCNV